MPFFSEYDDNSTMFHIIQHRWDKLGYATGLVEAVMRGPSPLSWAEREMIATYTSALNECYMCYGGHSDTARELGIEVEVLEAMVKDIETAPLEEKYKPVMNYVKKLALTPAKITQKDVDLVLEAGWSQRALEDIILVGSIFAMFNRIADGNGVRRKVAAISYGNAKFIKNTYLFGHEHFSPPSYPPEQGNSEGVESE